MRYAREVAVVIPAYNEEKTLQTTLTALYEQRAVDAFPTVLVDNASTDQTRAVAEAFKADHSDFDLRILEEERKGTGYAVSRGFDYAINELGARLVARTDADAVPNPHWLSRGMRHLPADETKRQAVTGPVLAARDEFYRPWDEVVWPLFMIGGAAVCAALERTPAVFKYMAGENTLVRSSAYEQVGGYPEGAIEEQCEDVALTRALVGEYGSRAIALDLGVTVRSSMRRVRSIGYRGMSQCYIFHPNDKKVRLQVNNEGMDHR